MPFSLVSSGGKVLGASGGNSNPLNTLTAKLIVVHLAGGVSGGAGVGTLADSKSNLWIPLSSHLDTIICSRFWFCINPIVDANHVFTTSGAGQYSTICIQAWKTAGKVVLDSQSGSQINATSITLPSIFSSSYKELFITGLVARDSFASASVNGGFSITNSFPGTGGLTWGGAMAYLMALGAAAQSPTWIASGNVSCAASMVAFKETLPFIPKASIRVGPWTTPK